jgi:hypothetical protein
VSTGRALRRHRDLLGAALSVHRSRPGPGTVLCAALLWGLAPAAILVNPDPNLWANIAFPVLWGVLVLLGLALISGEVLVVCERGLLVGSTAPFQRPSAIPYARIQPGSLVPVTGARRFSSSTGRFYPTSSTRTGWWVSTAVSFVGSMPERGPGLASVDGRCLWFVGLGRSAPERVTAEIGHAAGRAGHFQLANAALAAPPRELTGRKADTARLLPGYRG